MPLASPAAAGRKKPEGESGVGGKSRLLPTPYACVLLAITVLMASPSGKAMWGAQCTPDKNEGSVHKGKRGWIVSHWYSVYAREAFSSQDQMLDRLLYIDSLSSEASEGWSVLWSR